VNNLRKYGKKPFNVIVIHGGPGAAGEMAPVARELSRKFGVLEPLQTKDSVGGQIKELKTLIETYASTPTTLIGWSWGAWLGFILASKHPRLVKKLILVSSGPFEEKYAKKIMKTRLSRLSDEDKIRFNTLTKQLNGKNNKKTIFAQIGKLISKSDSYKPILHQDETIEIQYNLYQNVWNEASKLRSSGKLLNFGKKIVCPVVAIHGNYDPHPAEGVKQPLTSVLKDFKFVLLKNCGHYPWYEKETKDSFYKHLVKELQE